MAKKTSERTVIVKVEGKAQIDKLKEALSSADQELERLGQELEEAKQKAERFQDKYNNLKFNTGVATLEEELRRFRRSAQQSVEEFQAFLQTANLVDGWGGDDARFSDFFNRIKDGSITASQAITQVKTEMAHLMEENYSNSGGAFDAKVIQGFMASLNKLGDTVDVIYNKIVKLETEGVKAVGGTGAGVTDISGMMDVITQSAERMEHTANGSIESITNLVGALGRYAMLDENKLLAVSQAFRNMADLHSGSFSTKSVDNIVTLAKQLKELNSSGFTNIRFNIGGLKDFKVSKTLPILTEFLNHLRADQVTNLERLQAVDLSNLSNKNFRVDSGSFDNLKLFLEQLKVLQTENPVKDVLNDIRTGVQALNDKPIDLKLNFTKAGAASLADHLQQLQAIMGSKSSEIASQLPNELIKMSDQITSIYNALTARSSEWMGQYERMLRDRTERLHNIASEMVDNLRYGSKGLSLQPGFGKELTDKYFNLEEPLRAELDKLRSTILSTDFDALWKSITGAKSDGDFQRITQNLEGVIRDVERYNEIVKGVAPELYGPGTGLSWYSSFDESQQSLQHLNNEFTESDSRLKAFINDANGISGIQSNIQKITQVVEQLNTTIQETFTWFDKGRAKFAGDDELTRYPVALKELFTDVNSSIQLLDRSLREGQEINAYIAKLTELIAKIEYVNAQTKQGSAGNGTVWTERSGLLTDGSTASAEKLTQEIHNEQDAVRQADAEYQSHISSVEAAAKAEERKIKASELLADAMRGEESATDKATEAANRHQTAVDNQNASNDKEEQRMQRLAAAEAEYYAKQEKARADAEAKKQAQIDSEVAKHNAALDKEEAAVEAATKREIEAWDRAEKAKIASIEKAAAAAAAAEQKAAEVAVKRTAYDDAKRAVNQYYDLLSDQNKDPSKRADVVMTDAGWASKSGLYAGFAQRLNDATAAFNMLTDAQNKNNLSGQQVAAINELIATRQKDYALAVENTAAKEAEYAQKSEELNQKKQAEAEAVRAAKEAKQQEAEATKAQAQAERDAAKAAKEAEQNANKKKTYIGQLTGLLIKCDNAERKYAASSKLSNTKENYEGIRKTKDAVKLLLDELEKEEPDLAKVAQGIRACTEEYDKNNAAIQTNTSKLGEWMDSGVAQLQSRLKYSLGLAAVVYKAVGEVKKMVSTAVELDSAMNTLQIVTRASGAEMDEYGKRVSSMAKETAQATKDLIDATTVYARLGYSMDESAILSKYTAMLQSVGDIDASSAQNAITAIIKAFDKGVNDIEDVMDKMVLVGNGFPISVAQIAEGMNNAGSMLHVAGNSFEESIALLTAANSTIQNISKASTGLRTIAARIRKTTTGEDDEGEIVEEAKYQEMINALTKHHVDLIDKETNQYRSTYEIIKDIAAVWKDMTSMEQAAVVEALAGTRQQNIFASLMTQFGTAEDAVERMKDSAGELQEAYNIRMESIQAHLNTLKAAFDELSMKVVNSDLAKGVIDIVTRIVEGLTALIDKIGGVGVALAALGGLAAVKFITSGGLAGAILSVTKTVLKLGEAFALLPELLAVAGIVASIAGLVAIIKELKKRYDEAHPSLELAKKLLDEAGKKVDELSGKLETNKARIRELEELYRTGDFTVVEEAELRKLEAENALLETQLKIQKGIEAYRAKQVHDAAVENANTLLGNNADKYPLAQTIQNAIDNYRQAQKDLEDAQRYFEERGDKASRNDQTYVEVSQYNLEQRAAELDSVLQNVGKTINELDPKEDAKLIAALAKGVEYFTSTIDGNSKKSKKWAADLKDLEKRYGSNLDALKRLARGEQVTREEGEKLQRWMLDCRYTAEDLSEMLSQMGDEMSEEQSDTGAGNTFLDAQISKWGTMTDEIERARQAIDDYNNAMQGGNNGDLVAQMEEAWQKAVKDIDSGRIDSRAVWSFAEMAMSPQQLADLGYDAARIAQVIKSSFYQEMFKDEDNDDGYSYGQRLLHNLEANISNLEGISVWRDDTGIHYWIDDFAKLAEQLGISEGFLDALLDDLDAYGSQLLTDTKQNTALINTFLGIKEKADDAREAIKEFIAVTFADDKDVTDTTMNRILRSLHDQGYLDIDPSEYYQIINDVRAENKNLEEDNPVVTPELDDQPLVDDINNMIANIQNWLNNHPLVVSTKGGNTNSDNESGDKNKNNDNNGNNSNGGSSNNSSSNKNGKSAAVGKRPGYGGGETLVNEVGPELISDRGRAFIANNGKPGFVTLSKDAIVFNAEQTDEILKGKLLTTGRAAHAFGNADTRRGGLIGRLLGGRRVNALYQAMGTDRKSSPVVSKTVEAVKRCPRCGSNVPYSYSVCPYCRYDFAGGGFSQAGTRTTTTNNNTGQTQTVTTYATTTSGGYSDANPLGGTTYYTTNYGGAPEEHVAPQPTTWRCPRCGASVSVNKTRCSSCGYPGTDIRYTQDSNDTKLVKDPSKLSGSGGGNNVGGADYASRSDPSKVDWIAVRINRLQRTIADLEKVATSGFKKLDVRLQKTKDEIKEISTEIDVQRRAYDRYIQEANSVGLSSSIAAKVRNGEINISEYDDETRKQIDEYTEW